MVEYRKSASIVQRKCMEKREREERAKVSVNNDQVNAWTNNCFQTTRFVYLDILFSDNSMIGMKKKQESDKEILHHRM